MSDADVQGDDWATPSSEELDRVVGLLADPQLAIEFFQGLENPLWLEGLRERSFFTAALPVESVGENGFRFPPWPPGPYLVKMAEIRPALVNDILLEFNANANILACAYVLDAATRLPSSLASNFVDRAIEYLQLDSIGHVGDRIVKLLHAVASTETVAETQRLTDAIFRPPGLLDEYWYEQELPIAIDILQSLVGEEVVELLTSWLQELAQQQGDWSSHMGRPSVAVHQQNLSFGIINVLVDVTVNVANEMVRLDPSKLADIVTRLEDPTVRSITSERIAMHVITTALRSEISGAQDLGAERVLDLRKLDSAYRHEYGELADSVMAVSKPEFADAWFDVVSKSGPGDEEAIRRFVGFLHDKDPVDVAEEEIATWRHHQLRDFLLLVEDALPEKLKKYLASLDEELGERPAHPGFSSWSESFVGPTSPASEGELREMSGDQLVAYLRNWTPPTGQLFGPSKEGLGRALSDVIRTDAGKLEESSTLELQPTYLRSIIEGWTSAIKEGREIAWDGALVLTERISAHHDEGSDVTLNGEPWTWSHQAAARFVRTLLAAPLELRPPVRYLEQLLDILDLLCESSDPDESRNEGDFSDPLSAALNTVRSTAITALVLYLSWVDELRKSSPSETLEALTSKAWSILDRHLDPSSDRSPAVRSVYGQEFPLLAWIDFDWTSERADQILGWIEGGGIEQRLRDVGWMSYLFMRNPSVPMFELLKPIYLKRLRNPISEPSDVKATQTMASREGEHVLYLYYGMLIDIDSDDGLVRAFFASATPDTRASAMSRLGWQLQHMQTFDGAAIERLQRLWDWRMEQTSVDRGVDELSSFQSWFRSAKFPREWVIDRLRDIVLRNVVFDMPGLVAEELANYAREFPDQCFVILATLLDEVDLTETYWIARKAAPILAACLDSGNQVLRARAVALKDKIGQAGITELEAEIAQLRSIT